MLSKIDKAHIQLPSEIEKSLNSDLKNGLSVEQAKERLHSYGENVLESTEKISVLKILFENINNIIVYLLIAASVISFIMGDPVEGVAVIVAILIAVLSGFISEYKAQKSIESLQNMVKTVAKVKRDGNIIEIKSSEIVVGDILFIEEGDPITADARIIDSRNFACIESALTGESEAVEKLADILKDSDLPLGDRKNMIYTGTAAARGNAFAIVTATAADTEIGKISDLLKNKKKEQTPLQNQLLKLGKTLIMFSAIVVALVIILGIITGKQVEEMIYIGLILAIASVPEALPAVSTMTLALGMRIMAKHNALVKNLHAVETLGSTTVICTDKTGTLTENQMTVKEIFLADDSYYTVEGTGYKPEGKILDKDNNPVMPQSLFADFLKAGVLSSNAGISSENGIYNVIGDPTEGAIIVMGQKGGYTRKQLEQGGYSRTEEIPFNSKDKFMATLYNINGEKSLFIKGAADVLTEMSTATEKEKQSWQKKNEELAEKGLRVLAIGRIKDYKGDDDAHSMAEEIGKGIELLGLAGIIDPPREDVKFSVEQAQNAGIRVIMITGDHPKTAKIIAAKINMNNTSEVLTGREIDKLTEEELAEKIKTVSIFARVSPENKLSIVNALNRQNEITAMTGDGVNDAPALNGANIGVAMGIRGTDVAKDASDMILTDDKFSTIVEAVKEGRVIFDNIEKFIYFLFSCNVVEIMAIFVAIMLRLPMPLVALQILWLNLAVDVLPAMSLAWEKQEDNVMQRKPRIPGQSLLNRPFMLQILISGSLIGLSSLAVFAYGLNAGYGEIYARTMAFSTMALGQLLHVFNVRKKKDFGLNKTVLQNKFMIFAVIFSIILQLIAVYVPFFNNVMGTLPLDLYKWLIILAGAVIPTVIIQLLRMYNAKKREVV